MRRSSSCHSAQLLQGAEIKPGQVNKPEMRGVLGRVPTHDDAADQPVRILHRCQAVSMIVPQNTGTVECSRTGGKKTAAFGCKPGRPQPF